MFRPLGRIVVRDDQNQPATLVLGAVLAGEYFKPGYVYEFQEVLGEIVIKEVGPSAINGYHTDGYTEDRPYQTWAHDISALVRIGDGAHLMTLEEWRTVHGG